MLMVGDDVPIEDDDNVLRSSQSVQEHPKLIVKEKRSKKRNEKTGSDKSVVDKIELNVGTKKMKKDGM